MFCIHRDPKYWKSPDVFRPERFLDENGKIVNHEAFFAFGSGIDYIHHLFP